ncbi:MAG: hypothetical protein P4L49_10795 [Desulfosporosinus sp.]|nr:hypothetical protein [Desulfosporosinus sp.]
MPDRLDGLAIFVFSWIIFANLGRELRKCVEILEWNNLAIRIATHDRLVHIQILRLENVNYLHKGVKIIFGQEIQQYVNEYVNAHLPDEPWYDNYFDFVNVHDLKVRLTEESKAVRYIYKIFEGMQANDYASIL